MGRIRIDKTGNRYDMLTVIEFAGKNEKGEILWKCRCDCGNETIQPTRLLKEGVSRNCGCIAKLAQEERERREIELKLKMMQAARERAEQRGQEELANSKKLNVSLCWYCIRSAAPPSLQCLWDKSRGVHLPEGAKFDRTFSKTGADSEKLKETITVTSCPEFLSVYDKANAELLRTARKKNAEDKAKEQECVYTSSFSAKSGQLSAKSGQSMTDWWKAR